MKGNLTPALRRGLHLLVIAALLALSPFASTPPLPARAVISLSTTTAYTQNFDGMGTSATAALPTDWKASKDSALVTSLNVVISQVYGGGGNQNAPYKNDFVELFNRGTVPVDMTGWTIQYAPANSAAWSKTNLSGVLQAGQYYLIQEAAGDSCGGDPCGSSLPAADAAGNISMNASAAKVALVNNLTTLSGFCPTGTNIVDFVGYGRTSNVDCYETAPAPAASNITAALRKNNGCTETDNNSNDFVADAPNPRNTSSLLSPCTLSGSGAANPSALPAGNATLLTVAVTPGQNPPSTGLAVACDLSPILGANPQPFYDDGTHGDVPAGDNTFSFYATVGALTPTGVKTLNCTITDAQSRSGNVTINLNVVPLVHIHLPLVMKNARQ